MSIWTLLLVAFSTASNGDVSVISHAKMYRSEMACEMAAYELVENNTRAEIFVMCNQFKIQAIPAPAGEAM